MGVGVAAAVAEMASGSVFGCCRSMWACATCAVRQQGSGRGQWQCVRARARTARERGRAGRRSGCCCRRNGGRVRVRVLQEHVGMCDCVRCGSRAEGGQAMRACNAGARAQTRSASQREGRRKARSSLGCRSVGRSHERARRHCALSTLQPLTTAVSHVSGSGSRSRARRGSRPRTTVEHELERSSRAMYRSLVRTVRTGG